MNRTHSTTEDLFGYLPQIPPDHYPLVPGYKGEAGGPSQLAAEKIAPTVKGLRKLVLDLLKGGETLTADRIAVRLERDRLSIRPRVAELNKLGLIAAAPDRATNESGMTAHLWKITEAGRNV